MRKSRGALTPAWPGFRKPYCPARAAVVCSRMPCNNGLEQPYIITILREVRSMSNSPVGWRRGGLVCGTECRAATFLFSVGRGGFCDALGGERGAHEFVDMRAAFGI
jgi:hypothetical protein